jgi:hypothetical protein
MRQCEGLAVDASFGELLSSATSPASADSWMRSKTNTLRCFPLSSTAVTWALLAPSRRSAPVRGWRPSGCACSARGCAHPARFAATAPRTQCITAATAARSSGAGCRLSPRWKAPAVSWVELIVAHASTTLTFAGIAHLGRSMTASMTKDESHFGVERYVVVLLLRI